MNWWIYNIGIPPSPFNLTLTHLQGLTIKVAVTTYSSGTYTVRLLYFIFLLRVQTLELHDKSEGS